MLASSAITRSPIDRGCRVLKANFPGAPRTAQDYVRRAAHAEMRDLSHRPGRTRFLDARGCAGSQAGIGAKYTKPRRTARTWTLDSSQPAAAQARQEAGRFIHNVRRVAWRHLFRPIWGREELE